MLGLRHEEYRTGPDDLPFFLYPAIERGAPTVPREQNWHDDPEIQLCLEGSGTVLLDGESYGFERGDIVIANPNVLHCTLPKGRMLYACMVINGDYCRQVGIDLRGMAFAPHIRDEAVAALFRELLEIYVDTNVSCRVARLHRALLQLLIALTEKYTTPLPSTGGGRQFEAVKATIGYIRTHYGEKITLDQLARAVYTDKFTLCRDFKRLTGRTIMDYTTDYRCQAAAEQIAAGHTVTEAAHRCGFDNLSYFTRTFKGRMGRLPSAYKNENQ